MKQFSLKEYLKNPNKKVVTRNGEKIRIICTDRKSTDFPIVALCTSITGQEACRSYDMNGKYNVKEESILDLMFAEECDKSINTVKTAFLEKASEYAEKCFPSDNISNYGKHDVAFHSHIAGANWMLEKAIYWLQEHVNDYLFDDGTPERPWLKCSACMFDAFKKAMCEQL